MFADLRSFQELANFDSHFVEGVKGVAPCTFIDKGEILRGAKRCCCELAHCHAHGDVHAPLRIPAYRLQDQGNGRLPYHTMDVPRRPAPVQRAA